MILPDAIAILLSALALYLVIELRKLHEAHERRIKALEQRKPGVKQMDNMPEWQKPVENFTPNKPETLRPNQVRGREVEEREFEFDVKI